MQSPSDVSAADALLSLSCRHNNLADSSSKIDLPSVARIYQRRDRRRVLQILNEGILPSIKWVVVKIDFQLSWSQFFHRQLQVSFIFVPTIGDLTLVNVDTKMIEDSTDAVVVHGTHLVYVAVLSELGMITNGQMLVLTHGPHRATQGLDWLTGILEEA
jgi:hypothetical protein